MLSIHRHSRFIATVAAILLTLSSSGFTAVLHSCLMAERSCCNASMMTHMSGDDGALPGNPVLKNVMTCCAVTVAGGLNANPIVTGNQQPAFHHLDQVALLPPSVLTGAQQISSHPISASFSAAAFPPSVEKYVLNASFLI